MDAPRTAPRGAIPLLAVAAAVAVANLYYAQPLAAVMARDLRVSERAMGLALTLTQAGYALGMLLLVPIGDGRERRSTLVITALFAAGALLLLAAAPAFALVAAACLLVGFASALPQMVVPFAVGLVPVVARGRVIGIVMGGLLAGVLLSRTVSGVVGRLFGWRVTFVGAAVLMIALAMVMRAELPEQHPDRPLPYGTLVRSLLGLAREQPLLRQHALLGALGFACFSVFWSTLAFHLAAHGHGSEVAGLFGVLGVTGVLVAPLVGHLSARVPARVVNATAMATMAASFVVLGVGGASLVGIGVGVVLLDGGSQASHLANQTVVFGLRPELRNRLNAIYMVSYFVGGAAGSALGALAWSFARWPGVCAVGAALAAIGELVLLATRRAT